MSNDDELKNYLQGESDLSKLYREMPKIDLPDHLDASILAEAHRAVGSRPGGKPKHRWTFPLSMVASLFVAVMIALQLPYILKDAELTPVPMEERVAASPVNKNLPEPKNNSAKDKSSASADSKNMYPLAKKKAEVASEESSVMPLPASVAASPAPALTAKRLKESSVAERGMTLSKEKQTVGRAQGFVSDSLDQHVPVVPVLTENALIKSSKDEAVTSKSDVENFRPEEWLAHIKRLKQQGKQDEAKKELAEFKKRYPDYFVPAEYEIK